MEDQAGPPPDVVMGTSNCHHFVHCPLNDPQCRSLIQYASSEVLTEAITIPGHSSLAGRRAAVRTKMVLRRSFRAMMASHRAKLSMGGNFTGQNFLVDPQLFVKLDSIQFINFKPDEGKKDYLQFVRVVRREVFVREAIPHEVARWLKLISRGIQGYEYVISYHNSMMEHHQAITTHMSLYMIFEELEHKNPMLYKLIISWLSKYDGWKQETQVSALLSNARNYVHPKTGAISNYLDDIRGVLKLVRNCWQHPCRFMEDVLTLIIAVDFPDLLSDFQVAMFDAAQLGQLNLESSME